MKTPKTLTSRAKMMLLLMALRTIVNVFENNYVATMLSRLTDGSTVKIAIYFITEYLFTAIGAVIIGKWVKRHYVIVLRIGIIADLLFFIAFVNMKNNIISLEMTAILQGLALILYYLPLNFANSNWVKENERHIYSSKQTINTQILNILIPITFGGIISKAGYASTGSVMIFIVILQLLATLLVKDDAEPGNKNFDLARFLKNNWHSKDMKLFMLMYFCKGVALMGAQQQLVKMLILKQYGNEFQLGKITSIISISTIVLFWLFGKFASPKQYRKILILTTAIQLFAVISLVFTTNAITIIGINFCFDSCVKIIYTISDNFSFTMSNKYTNSKPEFLVMNELTGNAGRILSWGFLIIATLFKNSYTITIGITFINIVFLMMSIILNKILKNS